LALIFDQDFRKIEVSVPVNRVYYDDSMSRALPNINIGTVRADYVLQ
jgi:hypothetical protein